MSYAKQQHPRIPEVSTLSDDGESLFEWPVTVDRVSSGGGVSTEDVRAEGGGMVLLFPADLGTFRCGDEIVLIGRRP